MEQQEKPPFYKKRWFKIVAVLFIIGFIGSLFDDSPAPAPVQQTQPEKQEVAKAPEPSTTDIADALKEIERLMDISKQAGLVKSYEISKETPLTIYADKAWYTQNVQFKKDMLAKFSTLQQIAYGRHRLEVRDAYSNEKLAEVTAFSGSIELYK